MEELASAASVRSIALRRRRAYQTTRGEDYRPGETVSLTSDVCSADTLAVSFRTHPDVSPLFRPGGVLYGKNHAWWYPISHAERDGSQFSVWQDDECVPCPAHHVRERMFQLALVHTLGFADETTGHGHDACGPRHSCYPDAVYHSAKLVLECDEEQHFDDTHIFNRRKPAYQAARDREVNARYTQQGYWVVRVTVFTDGRRRRLRALTPIETYLLTKDAVQRVLVERTRQYDEQQAFGGKVIVITRQPAASAALQAAIEQKFSMVEINQAAARPEFLPKTSTEIATLRGTLLAQKLAMRQAEQFLQAQKRRVASRALLATRAAGSLITDFISSIVGESSSNSSSGKTTAYEAYWSAEFEQFNPDACLSERVAQMKRDIAKKMAGSKVRGASINQ
jgi:hypothetical protein